MLPLSAACTAAAHAGRGCPCVGVEWLYAAPLVPLWSATRAEEHVHACTKQHTHGLHA